MGVRIFSPSELWFGMKVVISGRIVGELARRHVLEFHDCPSDVKLCELHSCDLCQLSFVHRSVSLGMQCSHAIGDLFLFFF